MSHLLFCPLKPASRQYVRWAVLILPIFLCGCFDNTERSKQSLRNRELGISSIGRYFSFQQVDSSASAAETASAQLFSAYSLDLADSSESDGNWIEEAIALPDYVAAGREGFAGSPKSDRVSEAAFGHSRRDSSSSFRNTASLVFNAPFSHFFSSVFKQSTDLDKDGAAESENAEELNPFTEALQKQKASTTEKSSARDTVAQNDTASQDQDTQSTQKSTDSSDSNSSAANELALEAGYSAGSVLVIGDLDGSGLLQAQSAQQVSGTRFISADGTRDFNLYINSDAVLQKRSFYVDDINMDGNADILVTSLSALFGGVFLGDGGGIYRLADKFITGYEPTLVSAGPVQNGMRQIFAVSARTGLMRSFQYANGYQMLQQDSLAFSPSYLMRLVAPDTAAEYVMAAQPGEAEQILGWKKDGWTEPIPDPLGVDATVLSENLGPYSVKGYQVGEYASIVLAGRGRTFNVANMHLMPGTYLIIGDLKRRGALDVAVAGLESFAPAQ